KAVRNAKARERRKNDPEYAQRVREYMRQYTKQWRDENLEERRAYEAKWAREKRARLRGDKPRYYKAPWKTLEEKLATKRASRRRFHHRHKGEINQTLRKDRIENPAKYHEREARRWREHKEARTLQNFKARAKRYGVKLYCTQIQWLNLLKAFDFKCFYCHAELSKKTRTLDHKIPLSRGGSNEPENLVPCCRTCNSRKHNMTAEEFMLRLLNK